MIITGSESLLRKCLKTTLLRIDIFDNRQKLEHSFENLTVTGIL